MTEKEKSYLPFILITGVIFTFIIIMAIAVSQSFGDMAMNDAINSTGIQENQSFESLNATQQLSYYAGASLTKIPPGSEVSLAISFILAIIIGYVLIKFTARLFKGLFLRLFYFTSIWALIVIFQIAIGYLIFGQGIFVYYFLVATLCVASGLMLIWLFHPEWWIIDTIAIIIAITAAAFLGSSFGPLVIIIGLIALSIYDYVAVIKTDFMMKFAKGVMSAQLPAALLIPYDKKNSVLGDGLKLEPVKDRFERGFMVLGTGDLVFPTLLAVSCSLYMSMLAGYVVGFFIIVSYFVMTWVMTYSKYSEKITALPGLPFLCTGAIIGYIVMLIV